MIKSPSVNVQTVQYRMTLLYIKNNYNQNTDESSKKLSTTSINNCKTSENNIIRTTETPIIMT